MTKKQLIIKNLKESNGITHPGVAANYANCSLAFARRIFSLHAENDNGYWYYRNN